MNPRSLAGVLGIVMLAGCAGDGPDPAAAAPELAGRWVSVVVENTGDPPQHLTVADDRDLTRVVGIADPTTVAGHTTTRVRIFVPDDIPWMVRFNEMLLLTPDHAEGFCGALQVRVHVAWDAGYVELPVWMGEFPERARRPSPNCDASHRDVLHVPSAP